MLPIKKSNAKNRIGFRSSYICRLFTRQTFKGPRVFAPRNTAVEVIYRYRNIDEIIQRIGSENVLIQWVT